MATPHQLARAARAMLTKRPTRRTALLLAVALGALLWPLERMAEFGYIAPQYLYDPSTDSVFVVGKTVVLESLRPRHWLPFSSAPRSAIAWVEPWQQTVQERLAAVDADAAPPGLGIRPLPELDSVADGSVILRGARWDVSIVEDAITDPAPQLPQRLLPKLPARSDTAFWSGVVSVQATVTSYAWTATAHGGSLAVAQHAPQSRVIGPAVLFRREAGRAFALDALGVAPLHRGIRTGAEGEWPVLNATGPPG